MALHPTPLGNLNCIRGFSQKSLPSLLHTNGINSTDCSQRSRSITRTSASPNSCKGCLVPPYHGRTRTMVTILGPDDRSDDQMVSCSTRQNPCILHTRPAALSKDPGLPGYSALSFMISPAAEPCRRGSRRPDDEAIPWRLVRALEWRRNLQVAPRVSRS